MVTITFLDGTEITAEQNNTSFIVDEQPEFPTDLTEVTIEGAEGTKVLHYVDLVECASVDGRYWFTFLEVPKSVRIARKMQADLEYIAMMTDVELEDENA